MCLSKAAPFLGATSKLIFGEVSCCSSPGTSVTGIASPELPAVDAMSVVGVRMGGSGVLELYVADAQAHKHDAAGTSACILISSKA